MQKVSYVANGETTVFYFNFPYFERDNIVVTVNNSPAPSYNIIGTRGGLDPDFPFISGRVVFQNPPRRFDEITIERRLPLARPVDYQQLAKITPSMLNQDMNYTMELLKDVRDDLDTFQQSYADIVDKESTELLLSKIDLVNQNITDIAEQIEAVDTIPGLQNSVTSLQNSIETLSGNISSCVDAITTLNNKTNNLSDYVIESQAPTANNDYKWYRKYKSGWVEQGGVGTVTSAGLTVVLPKEMHDTNYTISITCDNNAHGGVFHYAIFANQTTQGFTIGATYGGNWYDSAVYWHVFGVCA